MKMFLEIFSGKLVGGYEGGKSQEKKEEERSGLVKRSFKNTVSVLTKIIFLFSC